TNGSRAPVPGARRARAPRQAEAAGAPPASAPPAGFVTLAGSQETPMHIGSTRSQAALPESVRQRIEAAIASAPVVLFMKGTRRQPQCGFSATVVRILDELVDEYVTVDVLADPEIREGIKIYSSWPTIPQLYVKGEFLGGCDIVKELYGSGELHGKLGLPVPERRVPNVRVTDAAAAY